MKKERSLLALIMMTVLCCGSLLTACGSSSEDAAESSASTISGTGIASDTESTESASSTASTESTDSAATDSSASGTETASEDVIGKVTYAGSSYLSVNVYGADGAVDDYASLDTGTLTETEETDYIYIGSDTAYYTVDAGALVEAAPEDVTVGSLVVETTSDDNVQQVIILESADAEAETGTEVAAETEEGTGTEDAAETENAANAAAETETESETEASTAS